MLSQVAEITMGQSPKAEDVNEIGDGLPLLNGPTEFGDTHPYPVQFTTKASKVCQQGDLLFCVRGSTTGRMNWADQPYAIGRGIAAIRHKKSERMQPFLRVVIEYELRNLLAHATGSTFPNVSSAMLARVDWPKLGEDAEQNASDCLALLDRNIRQLREMNRTLEDIARAVFRAWFVDFEPVRAKAAGATSFRGMPQDLFDALPDAFEQSEIGEIPANWKVRSLDTVVEHPRRAANPNYIDGSTPYIGLEHMPRRSITLSEWETAEKVSSNKHSFERSELLFGKLRPNFHKVGIAFVDGVCSTDIVVMRPRKPDYFGITLGYLSSDDFVSYNVAATSGTKMPRTSWEIMARYEIALPDLSAPLILEFDRLSRSIAKRLEANVHEGRTLAALRDTLSPKLISGELVAPSLEALGLKAVGDD